MLSPVEQSIIRGLVQDETYTRRVLPYVKDVYFETAASRTYYEICKDHFTKYDSCPTRESLTIAINELEGLTDEEFREIGEAFEIVTSDEEIKVERK